MTQQLEIHKCVKNFPPMSEEEFSALENSVAEKGLQAPVTVWKDASGKPWVIDGRHRVKVLNNLHKKGIKKAANGEPLKLQAVPFEGTESEAIEWASTLNGIRRNVTSSQMAMSAVASYELEWEAKRREAKEAGIELPKRDPDGDIAQRLADKFKTNRQYIFDCLKIIDKSRDVANKVIDGSKSIPEAMKAVKRMNRNLPAFPTKEQQELENAADKESKEDGKPAPATKPTDKKGDKGDGKTTEPVASPIPELPPVFDGLKQPVGIDHREIFAARESVSDITRIIGKARTMFEEYSKGPGGSWSKASEAVADFQSLIRHIKQTQPHCVCPFCDGTGKVEDAESGKKKKCGQCKATCYLDLLQFKALSQEMKDKVLAAGGEDTES